ncbi:DNA polymerase I [Buchananella hordeovulneris]|uniref:DNA polymerase I n=1 Tax=Buchananella hordeovulneris TaxID=52770 RepID=UPI0026DD4FA4|nr:DNA polymerase I [Buchananella hordeovulneris]MDO5080805.1 DNA polymerase I [Buchananella hordeovulneris]
MSTSRLLLIDGHSMAFRAYYALPVDNFTTSAGQATNAVHGFTSMLLRLLEAEKPTHVAVAFDTKAPTFRLQQYPEYKGTREATPEPFKGQVSLIQDVLDAVGVAHFSLDGFEADDILATLATQGAAAGAEVLLCSGDRDTFQLVTEHVTVLYPVKGVSELRRMTPAEVEARYGVPPQRYPHLAALVGETSDNLPGVEGVGPKTAADWLRKYDGLEGVLAHADQITGKRGQALRDSVEQVRRNRQLNRLLTDVELGVELADLRPRGVDAAALHETFDALEFATLRERVLAQLDVADGATAVVDAAPTELVVVDATVAPERAAAQLEAWQRDGTLVGMDVEGVASPDPARADAWEVAFTDGQTAVVYDLQEEPVAVQIFCASLSQLAVCDLKAIMHMLNGRLVAIGAPVFDVALAAYLCHPDGRKFDVAELTRRYLGRELEADSDTLDLDGTSRPTVMRAQAVRQLADVLAAEVERRSARQLLDDVELPVSRCLWAMENWGIAVDRERLAQLHAEFDAEVQAAARGAYDAIGKEVNLSSPKQLQQVLFTDLALPKTRKTKTGYSTDAEALTDLAVAHPHPFLDHLLAHRDKIKLRQIVETLQKSVSDDGRIHSTFQQTVAATGRLSSTDPNLQNIPARTPEGRAIRSAFVAGDGGECLLTADYSQIEMRILAHLTEDPGLIEAFHSGEDLHSYTASRVFGGTPDAVTPQQRSRIKAMTYGLAYGLSAYGLSKQLRIEVAEANRLRDDFFARFGAVRDYLEQVVAQARVRGYTETIMGRRRYLPDLTSDNRQRREMAERAALNAPIQGSAADIIKVAMLNTVRALFEAELESSILLQVHDELVLEIAPGELEAVQEIVRREMSGAVSLRVPLDVSMGSGTNWLEAGH